MHDPTKPWPETYKLPIKWTKEYLEWWAAGRALGIQYFAQGKPVYCPSREVQWNIVKVIHELP